MLEVLSASSPLAGGNKGCFIGPRRRDGVDDDNVERSSDGGGCVLYGGGRSSSSPSLASCWRNTAFAEVMSLVSFDAGGGGQVLL